jgi:hypothetical protein
MSAPKPIPAPLSPAVETALYVSGALCLLGTALGIWFVLSAGDAVPGYAPGLPMGPFYQVLIGLGLLMMPGRQRQVREGLLRAYRAAAGADAPPPPERPRLPDAVFLGVLFGMISLFSLPFLFGPAAVVSSTVALTRGHLKGLIGLALGLAGLVACAFLLWHLTGA